MKPLAKVVAVALSVCVPAALIMPANAEPPLTVMGFAKAAYNDSASSEVVVTLTRVDQDPATANEAFTLDCAVTAGTAVENVDYRLAPGLGTITFAPGVAEQTITVYTVRNPGPAKTLVIGCSNPSGPAPAATGEHPVAHITIVNTP